ncbi:MAG: lamin tail domain-containing protein [bacterium]
MMKRPTVPQGFLFTVACTALLTLAACSERTLTAPVQQSADPDGQSDAMLVPFKCTGQVSTGSVSCQSGAEVGADGVARDLIGGQNTFVKLTSSNVSYNGGTGIYQFDVTVQNLMNEAIGTPDGTTPDVNGIRVFFASGPTTTSGSGTITVANADGTATFTATNQPFFRYNNILVTNAVTPAHTWQLNVPNTVNTFSFVVLLSTEVQPLLVINEVMADPAGALIENTGEWFEIYNAGTRSVNVQNFVIADSAPGLTTHRPYHQIASSLTIASGGYLVFGRSNDTTAATGTGGVVVDYNYGNALVLGNGGTSGDAIKIARVYGIDTLQIDRVAYGVGGATDGFSRELLNPALDNSNMDGPNWANALIGAVYGAGGHGTPKAQNSTFTP